jgi:nucleoside-diphosphate-sugar epimerase
VYADFVSDIVNGRNIVMNSAGLAKRAFCYLADATEGFLRVLLNGESGKAYNIGSPDGELSILELAELLVKLFPEKKLQVVKNIPAKGQYLPSDILRNCPDISFAKQLGWQPVTSVKEGFRRTVQSYQ